MSQFCQHGVDFRRCLICNCPSCAEKDRTIDEQRREIECLDRRIALLKSVAIEADRARAIAYQRLRSALDAARKGGAK